MPRETPVRRKCWVCKGKKKQIVYADSQSDDTRRMFGMLSTPSRRTTIKCTGCDGKGWRLY